MADILDSFVQKQVQPTADQLAEVELAQIERLATQSLAQFLTSLRAAHARFWKNPNGVTPRALAKKAGAKATSLFTRMAQARAFVAQLGLKDGDGNAVPLDDLLPGVPEQYTIAANEDGTVVISEK